MSGQNDQSKFMEIDYLRNQISSILNFWYPQCMDDHYGGYINQLSNEGNVFDHETKHLVATSRFIYVFSIGKILGIGDSSLWETAINHGIQFLFDDQWDKKNRGFYTILKGRYPIDRSKQAYGHAFVLLALSIAYKAGIKSALPLLEQVFDLIMKRFYQEKYELCLDTISEDWADVEEYRGQNPNMHMCEAMIYAYEATHETKFLNVALKLARSVADRLSSMANDLIWEHYDENWNVDWDKNADDPEDFWRPYGYMVGHQLEWSKLLGILGRHVNEDWMLGKAERLFEVATSKGWDSQYGGFYFTLNKELKPVITDKYHWVMAEAIGAAAVLAVQTGEQYYWDWYKKIWEYSDEHLIDHHYGGWYRILKNDNTNTSRPKGDGVEPDYHSIGACFESIRTISMQLR